jgi:hypothetical protein
VKVSEAAALEKALALEMIALDLARLVRQATALELPLLPYLIDMALLEAERELRRIEDGK